jgi:tetratricopeptide (TPR) repeat protein
LKRHRQVEGSPQVCATTEIELRIYFFVIPLLRAEKVFRELKNNSGIGLVLGNMGDVYNLQLDYEKALEAEFEALKHTHKLNDEYYRAVTLYHIRQNIELKHC